MEKKINWIQQNIGVLKKISGILLIVSPIFVSVSYFLLVGAIWPQAAYYPYDYPEPLITGIRIVIYLGFIAAGISLVCLIRWGAKLLRNQPILQVKVKSLKKISRGILALWVFIAFGAGGVCIYFGSSMVPFWLYDAGPYLSWANDQDPASGITIGWHSAIVSKSSVKYGLSPDQLSLECQSDDFGQYHHVSINNLLPATTYYYQVTGYDIHHFTTAPVAGTLANYTFCIWADARTNNGYETALLGENLPQYMNSELKQSETELAFSVAAGDITSRGVDYKTWKLFLQDITTDGFASDAPNVLAVGNHEHHDDPTLRNAKKVYPYESFNFSYTYGQVHFLILDTFNYSSGEWYDVQFPEEQRLWAEQDLAAHQDVPFKFIVLHQTPINYGNFTTGGHHGNISTTIFNLANTYGVDAVIGGHSHHYEAHLLNGTYYFMIGTGGNQNRGNWTPTLDTDVYAAGGETLDGGGAISSWCRVDVSGEELTIRPRQVDGVWLRNYTITADEN